MPTTAARGEARPLAEATVADELVNAADLEAVGSAMNYAFVPGQVRIIDDVLLNRFATEHIERTAELGNRPKLRRDRLGTRLAALRAGRG